MQGGDRVEAVVLLAQATQRLPDASGEAAADEAQSTRVVAQADGQ